MIIISLTHGGHDWQKQNLVTLSDKKGSYDIQKCSKCGIEGKTYTLNSIALKSSYSADKINNCDGSYNVPKKIQIIVCRAAGKAFDNLTPDSVHDVVVPPAGHKNDFSGVWVMGVGEPVRVLRGEFKELN